MGYQQVSVLRIDVRLDTDHSTACRPLERPILFIIVVGVTSGSRHGEEREKQVEPGFCCHPGALPSHSWTSLDSSQFGNNLGCGCGIYTI